MAWIVTVIIFVGAACAVGTDSPRIAAEPGSGSPPAPGLDDGSAGRAGSPGAESPGSGSSGSAVRGESEEPRVALVLHDVDLTIAEVPLDDVHFDTFDGGSISLLESTPELRAELLDRIPPLDEPTYQTPVETRLWLAPTDLVLGYVGATGQAWAYPHRILNFHEIVNETLDDTPVLISYCPLCNSGVVYDRRLGDAAESLTFSNTSALYENDLVMIDRQTSTYWWQVAGQAIVGTLSGERLAALPSTTTTWESWEQLYPDTLVLSVETGFGRDYSRNPFVGYNLAVDEGRTSFPVDPAVLADDRLSSGTQVIGVDRGDVAFAVPLRLWGHAAVPVDLDGEPVIVFIDEQVSGGAAFATIVNGEHAEFTAVMGLFVDHTTGTIWDMTGEALAGELLGEHLTPVPSRSSFWFAYLSAFPQAEPVVP